MSGRRKYKIEPREIIKAKERRIRRFEQDERVGTRSNRVTHDKHDLIVKGGDDWIPKKVLAILTDAPDEMQFREN